MPSGEDFGLFTVTGRPTASPSPAVFGGTLMLKRITCLGLIGQHWYVNPRHSQDTWAFALFFQEVEAEKDETLG